MVRTAVLSERLGDYSGGPKRRQVAELVQSRECVSFSAKIHCEVVDTLPSSLLMLPTSTPSALKRRIAVTLWLLAPFSVCALAQTASPQPRPSPEQEAAIGASTIRGRVIYSDTSHPLRRAEVALVSEVTGNWDEPVVTDRNGEFVFTNVSAGKYFVVVSAPDIVSPRSLIDDALTLADQIALGQIESGFSEVTVDGRSSAKTEIRAARGGVELVPARLPAPAKAPTAASASAEHLASKADRGASSYVRSDGEFSVSEVRAGQYQIGGPFF